MPSTTHNIRALSTAEAEFVAAVKAASCGIGLACLGMDLRVTLRITVAGGASAGLAMASRRGAGSLVRHIHTLAPWLQNAVRSQRVVLLRVPGEMNRADVGTKHLSAPRMEYLLKLMMCNSNDGRSRLALRAVVGDSVD